MKAEPAVILGAVASILVWAYSYFFEGSAENALKLQEFLEGLVPLVAALLIRSQVTPARS